MKKEQIGYVAKTSFNNFDELSKYGEPIEVFKEKQQLKDCTPPKTQIIKVKITYKVN